MSNSTIENAIDDFRKRISEFVIIVADLKGLIFYTNEFCEMLFGREIRGCFLKEIMSNIDIASLDNSSRKGVINQLTHITLKDGEPQELYIELTIKGKQILCLGRIKIHTILEQRKKLVNFYAELIQDTRENVKQSYYELEQFERRHLMILNAVGDCIIGMDKNGNHTFVNPVAAQMMNCTQEELIGKPAHSFWHPHKENDAPYLSQECPICAVLVDGKQRSGYEKFIYPNGKFFDISYTSTAIIEKQDIVGAVVIFRDITNQKKNEKKLQIQAKRSSILLQLPKLSEILNESAFMQQSLEQLQKLLESHISFMHLVGEDQSNPKFVNCSPKKYAHYFNSAVGINISVEVNEILEDIIQSKNTIVVNDYSSSNKKNTFSTKGPVLRRFLGIPVMEHKKVVMIAGVVNKLNEYVEDDVDSMKLIANEIWRLLQRNREQKKLRQAAQVYKNTTEGVTVTDLSGKIIEVNESFSNITGYSRNEIIGKNPNHLSSGRHNQTFYKTMWEALVETGTWKGEIWNRSKDGQVYPENLTISTVYNEVNEPTGYVGVFSDISSLKKSEEQLEYLINYDPLTKLPNREQFNSYLRQAIKHAFRLDNMLALIVININNFKSVNETMGYHEGDELLINVSKQLKNKIRIDDFVARISADEFIVLIQDIDNINQVNTTTNKVLSVFATPFNIKKNDFYITACIGVSLYPDDGDDVETLVRNANTAMHRAKQANDHSIQYYSSDMSNSAFERFFLENALRLALKNEEFYLVYQPQICLDTGKMSGMEALLRWRHPKQGIVSPGRFIPIAEKSGIILEIGEWVLYKACKQAKIWLEQNLEYERIAVNVAAMQLDQENFNQIVKKVLKKVQLPANKLELEVTEGFVMQRKDIGIKHLNELRKLGIEIAVDDFGTGYSSLSYLKRLPIDKLKIDQSFIREIPEEKTNMAIVETIITLAKALKLKVIAEGVETNEQADFLRKKSCNYAQGFFYSKPIEKDKIPFI